MDWISTKIRFPKAGKEVLAACKNKNMEDGIWLYDLCYYYPETGWENRTNIEQDGNISGIVRYFRCDEDYDKIKRILALAFMNFLDENRPEGKMCLSNGECANIDDAFALGDWDMLYRYTEKYIKK